MISIIGWIGVVSYVIAYALLSIDKIKSGSQIYHLLNAIGGISLVVNALHLTDMPSFVVNFVWLGIAIFSMIRIYLLKKRNSGKVRKPLPAREY